MPLMVKSLGSTLTLSTSQKPPDCCVAVVLAKT